MTDKPEKKEANAPCEDCATAMAGWKRALADYDNLKKDLSRERTEMRKDAVLDAAHAFIAVLDNFDQAVKFTPEIPSSYQPQATSSTVAPATPPAPTPTTKVERTPATPPSYVSAPSHERKTVEGDPYREQIE